MSIKKMLFPLFVLVSVFLGVNFIRPAVLSVIDQQKMKEMKLAELSAIEKTAANIGSLTSSRKALLESEDGVLILSYLPEKPDQDRIVDILNYLGLKTGATIGNVSFEASEKDVAIAEPEPVVDANGMVIQSPPSVPVPPSFSVLVTAAGSYDGLKTFTESISMLNRLQTIDMFTLEKQNAVAGDGQVSSTDNNALLATIKLSFPYLPMASYPGAHLLPIFESNKIDISALKETMESRAVIESLPAPVLSGRRANPFVF